MMPLYDLILSLINPICPSFADHYPTTQTKVYPYVEISFPYVNPNNTYSDNVLLFVDIWDNQSGSVEEIETIAENIDKALNRLKYNDDKIQLSIYKNNPFRYPITDVNVDLQRRQLRFVLKTYYK